MSVPPRAVQLNEANAFLKEHPEVQFVDLLIADMNGVVRGKRIDRNTLHKVYEKGINLPASLFALDINGSTVESTGLGLDIGPASAALFADRIRAARTVFWNGPMGVFEIKGLELGTKAVAQALTEVDGLSVVGGGDSASAVRTLGFADDQFGHISTGGGASLELMEGKELPGIAVLKESN